MKRFTILPRPTILLLCMMVWAIVPSLAEAVVPQLITLQGRLTDTNGNPVANGSYSIKFEIFDAVGPGGGCLWTETQSVFVQGGVFSVVLGSTGQGGIPDSAFSDSSRWVAITVGNDPEMTPRMRLTSGAFSYRVNSVEGASGGNIYGDLTLHSTFTVSDLAVTNKATIGPGNSNTGLYAFVAGAGNTVRGRFSVVSGGGGGSFPGDSNSALSDYSTISGGRTNLASGEGATVGGGEHNWATSDFATINGGENNTAGGLRAAVGGGYTNSASATSATVGGGDINMASGNWATVSGGSGNTASGIVSTVAGGSSNLASAFLATIGGGGYNTAVGLYSVVGGGQSNTASKSFGTIAGGFANIAGDTGTTVGGGVYNYARGRYSVVGGGGGMNPSDSNTAQGEWSVVGGGRRNSASWTYSTVGGGQQNVSSGHTATVGGGAGNTASGDRAMIPGGQDNVAAGAYSFAAGRGAQANNNGAFVWADNSTVVPFASTANNQFLIRANGGVGIGTMAPDVPLQVKNLADDGGIVRIGANTVATGIEKKNPLWGWRLCGYR